jgi:hypothetical protein
MLPGGAGARTSVSGSGARCARTALVLWNGRDPILKERLFGLTNTEGNHGEDVKEYYFYLDATPTSSYLKMLYKYPQAECPYADLVAANRVRGKSDPEYELLDTGVLIATATSMSLWNMRRPRRRISSCKSRCTTGGLRTQSCMCSHPVVPAHLVVGGRRGTANTIEGHDPPRHQCRASRAQ